MQQSEFNMLADEKLVWICVEPAIRKARGQDLDVKSKVVSQLNNGQRALFMFQVLYGHANYGIAQFFHQISYMLEKLDIWTALKSGMKYFDETDMLDLIEKMEHAYYATTDHSVNTILLDELDRQYKEKIPATLKRIGQYIRSNRAEFIQFED